MEIYTYKQNFISFMLQGQEGELFTNTTELLHVFTHTHKHTTPLNCKEKGIYPDSNQKAK